MPQRHGSANKSIGGIYADKSTVTVAEGGAVQGNKASMGGGIYMNASSAAVAKGSALYNNKAAYGGDDLFASAIIRFFFQMQRVCPAIGN